MIAGIIKDEVCVTHRSLRWITQSEAWIISISCENRIQQLFYYIFKSWKESNNQDQWINIL